MTDRAADFVYVHSDIPPDDDPRVARGEPAIGPAGMTASLACGVAAAGGDGAASAGQVRARSRAGGRHRRRAEVERRVAWLRRIAERARRSGSSRPQRLAVGGDGVRVVLGPARQA